jgi:hypothetical protein
MTYTPNFTDPRVLKRCKQAYGFAKAVLRVRNSTPVPKTAFDKFFGQQQNELARWLRDALTVCVDEVFMFGESSKVKEYSLNKHGADALKLVLQGKTDKFDIEAIRQNSSSSYNANCITSFQDTDEFDLVVVREWAKRAYPELETLNFLYEDKSDRLWHPLQSMRTSFREPIMAEAGLVWNYDIDACAPTLILQHAQQLGMDLWLPHLNLYLKEKNKMREHVAQVGGIDVKQAKVLINALFNSAVLGSSKKHSQMGVVCKHKIDAYNEKNGTQITFRDYWPDFDDKERMRNLQRDTFLIGLRADIKTCWEAIAPTMSRVKAPDKSGKLRLRPVSSKQKWDRYFQLERRVMDVVRAHLLKLDNLHFLEHDGWRCKKRVDLSFLSDLVFHETGFRVTFKEDCRMA